LRVVVKDYLLVELIVEDYFEAKIANKISKQKFIEN
jgi:hypothetical protein